MHPLRRLIACALVATPLLVAGCDGSDRTENPIPAGVSVHPPRQAPQTGSLVLPGQDSAAVEQPGMEQPGTAQPATGQPGAAEPALPDTVGGVVEGTGS